MNKLGKKHLKFLNFEILEVFLRVYKVDVNSESIKDGALEYLTDIKKTQSMVNLSSAIRILNQYDTVYDSKDLILVLVNLEKIEEEEKIIGKNIELVKFLVQNISSGKYANHQKDLIRKFKLDPYDYPK